MHVHAKGNLLATHAAGNDCEGPLQTHVQSLATNRQQCVPKLCMWFFVHVFMSAWWTSWHWGLLTILLWHYMLPCTYYIACGLWYVYSFAYSLWSCWLSTVALIPIVASLVALCVASMTIFGIVMVGLCWRKHKLKQKGELLIRPKLWHSACFKSWRTVVSLLLPHPVSRKRSPSHSPPPPPPNDPDGIQLQPNPSYCSVERNHQ